MSNNVHFMLEPPVRIPGHADHDSEAMAIMIPK